MKAKILFGAMCLMPVVANAAIPYRVQQVKMPPQVSVNGHDPEAFARIRRFYVGGAYNFSIWNDGADDNVHINGKNTSSFEAMVGIRPYDIFRLEANYINTQAKWDAFKITGHSAMINALIDARINNMYRLFYRQRIVPYVGVGAGLTWNASDDVSIDTKITPTLAAMTGIGFELGDRFTVDLGYRYMYIFSPKIDMISDFAPAAHQLRAGVRVNF